VNKLSLDPTPSNLRLFTALLLNFAILITPIAAVAARTERSESRGQRSNRESVRSEESGAKAAAKEFAKWQELLAPMPCALLHGRIAPEEKDGIMEKFRRGETKALIATTVIEVGIDVPNASIMLVESAERFGLAQLHQLRGRIGRGAHKSYCILLTGSKADDDAKTKLNILAETSDGFAIAEADLRIRGPGDILGTAQSGLPPLKIGDVFNDAEWMKLARNHAFLISERDPQLLQPEHATFRRLLTNARRGALAHVS